MNRNELAKELNVRPWEVHDWLLCGCPAKNKSAIHWDMICDMRTDSEILVDGELFYKNGKFVFDK